MKNFQILLFSVLFLSLAFLSSCSEDEVEFDYHAHINAPDNSDKHVGDTMHIHVDFEEHNGLTVHHVNVRIINADDNTEVYNMPTSAHVHSSGSYAYHDDFVLDVDGHTDWILEAKVWAEEEGSFEEISTVEFHVHP